MKKEKAQQILDALEGITYEEWTEFRERINHRFKTEILVSSRKTQLNDAKGILSMPEHHCKLVD